MAIVSTELEGCFEIISGVHQDLRGSFVKVFQGSAFKAAGLRGDWQEIYYTTSQRNVLRGMHFQTPPADHVKLVTCVAGKVLDVIVDLRNGSPTYGHFISRQLSPEQGRSLYIPSGMAHGFLALEHDSIMQYMVTSEHAPENDAGILWSSFGFSWPVDNPILSERDKKHPELSKYTSPFFFQSTRQ